MFTLLNESTTSLFLPGDQTGTDFFILIFTVFKKRSNDRNVSDDYGGVAMGASIRKAVVVPLVVTAWRLNVDGVVTGRQL